MKDQKTEEYWISVKQLMTPETVVIDQPPFFTSVSPNPIKMYVAEFFRNGKLQRRKIKTHPAYPYGFHQEKKCRIIILDKLETMIEQRLIRERLKMERNIQSYLLH